jgi:recombinational DNA repair ATPase RecF
MMRITQIRLVNFHNFIDETIEVADGGHLFLLGDNGSGKTTVLDAALTTGIAAFKSAVEALDQALTAQSLASTHLENAEEAWTVLMMKAYGALVADEGKKGAERYFPKIRSGKKNKNAP